MIPCHFWDDPLLCLQERNWLSLHPVTPSPPPELASQGREGARAGLWGFRSPGVRDRAGCGQWAAGSGRCPWCWAPPAAAHRRQAGLGKARAKIKQPRNQPVVKIATVVTFGEQGGIFTDKCIDLGLRGNYWTRLTPSIATCAATAMWLCIQTCICAPALVLRSLSLCSARAIAVPLSP